MAYDVARGETVLYGGYGPAGNNPIRSDTWVWDGTDWTQRNPATYPTFCPYAVMVYEAVRSESLLFCGYSAGSGVGETWTWNGRTWTRKFPTTTPSPRQHYAMAYDAARGETVLFSGRLNTGGVPADTWVWTGADWIQRSPATQPPARYGASVAYDAARGEVVLFSGFGAGSGGLTDTWTWNGVTWTPHPTSQAPPARWVPATAYDTTRDHVVLFGGFGIACNCLLADTWVWDGNAWTQRMPVTSPAARYYAGMAFHQADATPVLFGGQTTGPQNDTWTYDDLDPLVDRWVPHPVQAPTGRYYAGIAYDGQTGTTVLYGGVDGLTGATKYGDTWTWNGSKWAEQFPRDSPGTRVGAVLVYDRARNRLLLFGGSDGAGAHNDTWTWTSGNWVPLSNGGPSPRWNAQAVFDERSGTVLLYGGCSNGGNCYLFDTWSWNGTAWTQVGSNGPTMAGMTLAHHGASGQTILYGGMTSSSTLRSETWSWTGTAWTQLTLTGSPPPPRYLARAVYDRDRGLVVLFGGCLQTSGCGATNETWTFDGRSWRMRNPVPSPPARWLEQLAYDEASRQTVLFSGRTTGVSPPDTWTYD